MPTVPDPDTPESEHDTHAYSAVTLFEDRAAAVLPGFSVDHDNATMTIRICQRLDGLPLAIELAAAWLRVLSLEQILSRLQDRYRLARVGDQEAPARHQTLRAAIEWSFDLCSDSQRALWRRFSVFAGDFDIDAAEVVCAGDGLEASEVFTGLAGLLDKSVLVRMDGGVRARYRMLDTIRQYGAERLTDAHEDHRLARRHRDYYLRLAERAEADSCGPRQAEWCVPLCAERANLFAALDHCLSSPREVRTGLRMCAVLWFYWVACGYVRDGRHWMDRALALGTEPCHERARALWINGWIAFIEGDHEAGLPLLREARALAERLGDEGQLTYALQYLAGAEMFVGNMDPVLPMLEEALARHRAAKAWTAPGLLIFAQRARPALRFGDLALAVDLLTECVSICDSLGERWARSWAEWNLGTTWWAAGDVEAAAAHLHSALRTKQDLSDVLGIPFCVEALAWVAITNDDAHRAATLFGAADVGWECIGGTLFGFRTLLDWRRQNRARAQEALGSQEYAAAHRRGGRLPRDELIAYALGDETPPPDADGVPEAQQVLTKRERQVAAMVAQGLTNKEIACALVIAQRTAEGHVENILSKLGFTSRTQIAVWVADQPDV